VYSTVIWPVNAHLVAEMVATTSLSEQFAMNRNPLMRTSVNVNTQLIAVDVSLQQLQRLYDMLQPFLSAISLPSPTPQAVCDNDAADVHRSLIGRNELLAQHFTLATAAENERPHTNCITLSSAPSDTDRGFEIWMAWRFAMPKTCRILTTSPLPILGQCEDRSCSACHCDGYDCILQYWNDGNDKYTDACQFTISQIDVRKLVCGYHSTHWLCVFFRYVN